MLWKKDDPAKLIQARLQIASPEAVFASLQEYDVHIKAHGWFSGDDDLEKLLLARNDKLINLGLAQFGASTDVLLSLFSRASQPGKDGEEESYNHALRLACLSNSNHHDWDWPDKGEWQELINPILLKGKGDESHALFINPTLRGEFFKSLFAREGIFQEVPTSDWLSMVVSASYNPRLNIDNSSADGPDFTLWDIQKGILIFLETAPTDEKHAVGIAHTLLSAVEPSVCSKSENVLSIIERWRNAKASDYKGEEKEGYHTQLSQKDELLCLIAALYGKYYKDKETKIIGVANDDDIVLRCAYYGNADLSIKEMKAAYAKDKSVFVFAALKNDLLYWNKDKRAELENHVGGDNLWIYKRHCEQLHKKKKWFDPNPITDFGREVMEDEAEPAPSADTMMLEKVVAQNDALKNRLDKYESKISWAIIIIIAAFFFLRH